MSDEAGLWDAIREEPDDDTPRRILADWYEDNGQPERAELMRLQLDRAAEVGAGWSTDDTPPRVIQPSPRETALHESYRRSLPPGMSFDRGMPEFIELQAWEYAQRADEIGRISPVLSVALTGFYPPQADELSDDDLTVQEAEIVSRVAAHPSLASWVNLHFAGCPGWDNYQAILGSPHLTRLRRLFASSNETGPYISEFLNDRPERFQHLRYLELGGSNSAAGRPGDDEVIHFVTCPHLANLEHFGFEANSARDEGYAAIATSKYMTRLHSLDLGGNDGGLEGWKALANSKRLMGLRHLDLSCAFADPLPGDEGLACLLRGGVFARLRYLAIQDNGITDVGLARLARSKKSAGLRSLVIGGERGGIRITSAGLETLANSPHTASLRRLSVSMVTLDGDGASTLAAWGAGGGLREFHLSNSIVSEDARAILTRQFREGLSLVRCE